MAMAEEVMSLLISFLAILTTAMAAASDEAALLAFKAQASDGGSLASWNSSAGFCSWEGVSCSHRRPVRVVALRLDGAGLAGTLSPAIGNLTFLRTLNLSFNSLHGEIPASLGRLHRLQRLDMGDNSFSGEFPLNLSSCISMTKMILRNNKLSGRIPAELGEKLASLEVISMSNNSFTGLIPASFANLSYLRFLDLSINQLGGSIPPGFGGINNMRYFDLGRNNLSGMLPPSLYNCSSLEFFSVVQNIFYGRILGDIGNKFPMMNVLGLGGNQFTGTIPSSVSNLSYLTSLGLGETRLSGYVPPTLGKLGALNYLHLSDTNLEANGNRGWEFISSLANCSQLGFLSLGGYSFEGFLPASVTNLSTTLQQLYLIDSKVSGVIPGLSWYLDLSYNSLSGSLPYEVGSLENLNQLILSGNQLSGKIPDSIKNCIVLEWLLLDNNLFDGSIPESLMNIKGLSKLNLTMNKLSGIIPESLGSIGNLQELYLAHNNLSGSIPAVLAVSGNINLCGGTPQLHLVACSRSPLSKNKRKMSKSLVISLAAAGAILLSLAVILLIWILRKKLKQSQRTIVQYSSADDSYERIPYHALLRGTNEFSEANLLGTGSYGAVYKCVLDTEERTLAVKVFNLGQSRYSKSFKAECEAMRRIRHRCLIKIITSCSSINHQGQEFKALVFEFMANGNLDGWLHPKSQDPTTTNTLSLAQRLDIAVDIVDAVEYLHNYCQPLVIHCDLKPSNILLAEDMSARVGDFGISRILQENTKEGTQASYSSTGIRGSIGYVAPEYGEGSLVSTVGDIYSLGILLLEMFTGRSPTEGMFRDSLDLHKFVEDALPDRTLEVAHPTMWLHSEQYDNTTSVRIQELLASVLRLGISCSKQHPRDRALTRDATAEMHAIRDAYLKFTWEMEQSEKPRLEKSRTALHKQASTRHDPA